MKKNFNSKRVSVNEVINVINGYNKKEVINLNTPEGRNAMLSYVRNKLSLKRGMSDIEVQMALRNANGENLNTPSSLFDFLATKSNGRVRNERVMLKAKPIVSSEPRISAEERDLIELRAIGARIRKEKAREFEARKAMVEVNPSIEKYGTGNVLTIGGAPNKSVVVYDHTGVNKPMYWEFVEKPTEVEINGLRAYYRKLNGISYKDAYNAFGKNFNAKHRVA